MNSSNVEDKLMITILQLSINAEIILPKGYLNKYSHNLTRPLLEETKQIHAKINMPNYWRLHNTK